MNREGWIKLTMAGACVLFYAHAQAQTAAPSASGGYKEVKPATAAKGGKKELSETEKADLCKSYNKRLTAIRDQQRRGVKAAIMDKLNQEYDEIDQTRRDTGC